MRSNLWRLILVVLLAVAIPVCITAETAPKKPPIKTGAKCSKPLPKTVSKKAPVKAKAVKKPAKTVAKPLPKLLDLGSDRCVPCKMMIPVLNELAKEYKGKLRVQFIDVWKDEKAGEKYHVRSIPTQIFYNAKGKELYRHEGYYPKKDIIAKFKELGISLKK